MKAGEIDLGAFYVSKTGIFVREIVGETESGRLMWRDYSIDDGCPIGQGACGRRSMARWAEREATSEEIARLQIDAGERLELTRATTFAASMLANVPDDLLLDEARRRRLKP